MKKIGLVCCLATMILLIDEKPVQASPWINTMPRFRVGPRDAIMPLMLFSAMITWQFWWQSRLPRI